MSTKSLEATTTRTTEKSSSFKTARSSPISTRKRRNRIKKNANKKTYEFLCKIENLPIPTQRTLIAEEHVKIHKLLHQLGCSTSNPQHLITRKKLEKKAQILSNYASKLASSPSNNKTAPAEVEEVSSRLLISTPKTAISPVLERMEERIEEIRELQNKTMDHLCLVEECIGLQKIILQRFRQELKEEWSEIQGFDQKIEELDVRKQQLYENFCKIEQEHSNISNDMIIFKPKITEMEKNVKTMENSIRRWDSFTSTLDSGDSILSWEFFLILPFYNLLILFLYYSSLTRDEIYRFFNVFMNDFKQRKWQK